MLIEIVNNAINEMLTVILIRRLRRGIIRTVKKMRSKMREMERREEIRVCRYQDNIIMISKLKAMSSKQRTEPRKCSM